MRITQAQINTTVGDIAGNLDRMRQAIDEAGPTDLVVFPELCVVGYPPQDLLDRPAFAVHAWSELHRWASALPAGIPPLIVGCVAPRDEKRGRALWNAGVFIRDGHIPSVHPKSLLPTYDVFDEDRWFQPLTDAPTCVEVAGRQVGITVCEDIWRDPLHPEGRRYALDPIARVVAAGAELVINLSASPFSLGKTETRREVLHKAAVGSGVPLVYVNAVGANDSLVFDGRSLVFLGDGTLVHQAAAFEEAVTTIDLDTRSTAVALEVRSEERDATEALTLGIRDYFSKIGASSAVIGLSGGIDSALTAALAVRALGKSRVVGIGMPSEFSSDHSLRDAQALADNLGIEYHVVPIRLAHEQMRDTLEPVFGEKPVGVTDENLQARLRGMILMGFSNRNGHLVLSTGNKSEVSVGYCTLYGDMAGGLAVISDVPKTLVYSMCRFINQPAEIIPISTIEKPPSAELRPGQRDDQSLPPYEVLDPILEFYIRDHLEVTDIVNHGFDEALVRRIVSLVHRAEYKRRQMPLGLRVTSKAFGPGRRMPIASRWRSR
ncbi:MAG: NAD+ synthase (glutamine-hydrolyzing) [Myxococcota bacterium]|jgi:NAD+ synthase (glutamine-hydrolysing)